VSRCSIILVHGTWGRGFFPKRREASLYPPNKRWWFEEGSQFRAGLDAAIKRASPDWPIRSFLWSGANSVHSRDLAARELSEQLRKDLQYPDAEAVIIAHSHGGNVALRALQHLDSMTDQIRVVTLATPFLRVFARRSLQLPMMAKLLVWAAILIIFCLCALGGGLWILFATVNLPYIEDVELWKLMVPWIVAVVLLSGAGFFVTQWLIGIFTNSQAALAIEEAANYDTKAAATPRMLVIRGVDDEASLSLAAGSIGSRLSYLMLVGVLPAIYMMTMLVMFTLQMVFLLFSLETPVWPVFVLFGAAFFSPIFLVLPGMFKSIFFGREFLVNALVCDIAVDSVPDTLGQVEAITLEPVDPADSPEWISLIFGLESWWPYRSSERLFSLPWWSEMMRIWWRGWRTGEFLKVKGRMRINKSSWQLRHGIYNHPDCVDTIVRWLRRVT
jgi:hypothetical protein